VAEWNRIAVSGRSHDWRIHCFGQLKNLKVSAAVLNATANNDDWMGCFTEQVSGFIYFA
jgi:hypothetical protein